MQRTSAGTQKTRSHPRFAALRALPFAAVLALLIALPLGVGAQGQGEGPQGSGAQTPGPQGAGAQTPGPQGSGAQTPGPQGSGAQTPGPQGSGAQTPGPQGSGQNAASSPTPGASATRGSADKGIEKLVFPNTGGTGSKAVEVTHGQPITYEVRVTGAPPGQRAGNVEDDLSDNVPAQMEYRSGDAVTVDGATWPQGNVSYDGNKLTVRDVPLADGKTTVVRFRLWVSEGAPCNHVATNVAHVNGIGSDQAQVRIVCPTPTATLTTGASSSSPTASPTATTATTAPPRSAEVSKTLEDNGRTITQINPSHYGKELHYNILLKRKGGVAGRTQMAFDDLIGQGCIADGSGLIKPLAAEVDEKDLGIGDDFSIQIEGCRISGWVSGDNKGNLDPDAPGNRFHVHITVQVAAPGSAAVTTNAPTQVVNTVTVNLPGGGGGGGPCCEQSFTLTTPVNPSGPQASLGQGPRAGGVVNLPSSVSGQLSASVDVAGITFPRGEQVTIVALPPGAVLRSGPNAVIPPGSVLGIVSRADLGELVAQAPVFVDVLDVGAVRAPAPGALPQSGTGPAPLLLPQTGAMVGVGTAGPFAAVSAAGVAMLLGLIARRTSRQYAAGERRERAAD